MLGTQLGLIKLAPPLKLPTCFSRLSEEQVSSPKRFADRRLHEGLVAESGLNFRLGSIQGSANRDVPTQAAFLTHGASGRKHLALEEFQDGFGLSRGCLGLSFLFL